MLSYQSENPYDIKEELLPLHICHYEDDHRKDTPLDINWEQYKAGYEAGLVELVTARDEGAVVGYITSIIGEHQHTQGTKSANMDTLFVSESHRNEGIATELVNSMEEHLIAADVSWFSAGFREESTAQGVLGSLGYNKIECTFGKSLRGIL